MKKLDKNNFNSWKEYYFEYQRSLSEYYYIPFFQKNKIELKNKNILEIGCGNGGFISAFGKFSDNCVGFDLKDLKWEKTNIKYHKLDVFDDELINKFDSDVWNAISVIWETPCQLAGTLVQDLLELGKEARFNIPGQQLGNWNWRLDSLEPLSEIKDKLLQLNKDTKRI